MQKLTLHSSKNFQESSIHAFFVPGIVLGRNEVSMSPADVLKRSVVNLAIKFIH